MSELYQTESRLAKELENYIWSTTYEEETAKRH